MNGPDLLVPWLRALDEEQLEAVLVRRPDLVRGLPPRDLDELAERLWHGMSLIDYLLERPVPVIQVLEAARALGDWVFRDDLVEFLDSSGSANLSDHERSVTLLLAELAQAGVIVITDSGEIRLPPALAQLLPKPLGFGRPINELLTSVSAANVNGIQRTLGLSKQKLRKADADAAVASFFRDPVSVRTLLDSAPAEVRTLLDELTRPPALTSDLEPDDRLNWYDVDDPYDDHFDGYGREYGYGYGSSRYRRNNPYGGSRDNFAREWAREHGLLLGPDWGYELEVPAEVTRVLRGPAYRAPFDPQAPPIVTSPVDVDSVERESSAALSQFAADMLAVLDHVSLRPATRNKTGGIGLRELARIAKQTGVSESNVRLVLELAGACRLLVRAQATVAVSDAYPAWRDSTPGTRVATLLVTWWNLGSVPTDPIARDGNGRRVLHDVPECASCRSARQMLIGLLAHHSGSTTVDSVAPALLWRSPRAHTAHGDTRVAFETVWNESMTLGVIAHGSLSDLGRALIGGSPEILAKHCASLLPPTSDTATFGTDLTAYVTGAPSSTVSTLLDSAADREGRGGATTWRFTATSIRRAFDNGAIGDELIEALAAIATNELPQPLRYLIADVDRRHGHLRVSAAQSYVVGDDPALLAELVANRKLAKFGLRMVAPTVVVSTSKHDELMTALRDAGYLPIPAEDEPARTAVPTQSRTSSQPAPANVISLTDRRARPGAPAPNPSPDFASIAHHLITGGDEKAAAQLLSVPEASADRELRERCQWLSESEIRQLAHAIQKGGRLRITYQSESGGITDRVIEVGHLHGWLLDAYCLLRQDERYFNISRIRSVSPA